MNEKYSFVTFLPVVNLICVSLISAKNVIFYLVLLSKVLGSCAEIQCTGAWIGISTSVTFLSAILLKVFI